MWVWKRTQVSAVRVAHAKKNIACLSVELYVGEDGVYSPGFAE